MRLLMATVENGEYEAVCFTDEDDAAADFFPLTMYGQPVEVKEDKIGDGVLPSSFPLDDELRRV